DERHQVVIREGAVIQAGSNAPREYLAQFLMNMGMITEDEYTQAFQQQLATKVALGKILVDSGKVPEDAVRNALSLKFREALLGCFDWTDGRFTFTPGEASTPVQGLDVSVSLLDVHREADLRQTAWRAIREVFPTGRVRLRIAREQLAGPPEPGSLDDRLYALIEEGATIDDLVLGLHSTDFFLYQRLFALHRLGAISVLATESPTVPTAVPEVLGSEQGPDEILRAAQAFYTSGNVADAAALARRAYEVSPSAQTANFLRQAEAALADQLKSELVHGGKVPSLKVSAGLIRKMPLSAPERYLLSRIDGQRTVEAIVQVSPIHELDALRCFKGFVDQGLIDLR
ncbi:MAG TPA: DUF4388 domain-containing protein, partial [Myxococcaceae bacterium]|nr:DUF4388 domain-containing protein [Myxococcaceae bacterium]